MSRQPKEPRRRLGLRGEVLLYVGLLWLLQGVFVSQGGTPDDRPLALHEMLPPLIRTLGWTVTGVLGIIFAFQRWPGADRFGFGALCVMPFERCLSWVITGVFGLFGVMPSLGPFQCFSQSLVWGVVTLLVYRIGAARQMLVVHSPDSHPPLNDQTRIVEVEGDGGQG